MDSNTVWKVLNQHSWHFSKRLPESGIVITGQVTPAPIQGTVNRMTWHEQGSWSDRHDKSYVCSLTHEYVLEGDRLLIYSGPETTVLLHEFCIKPFQQFPIVMQHTHYCGQDTYACEWIFLNETSFSMQYTVLGPKKQYRIEALYTAIS
ncbi:MAG: hypothetical protein RLZ35_1288 [Pseudomonadota bacterium]|jgi:hypothetical protein